MSCHYSVTFPFHAFRGHTVEMVLINETFVITVLLHDTLPFSRRETFNKSGGLEGLDIDLIYGLSMVLGFSHQIRIVADDNWGLRNPVSGQWNGMVGEVIDGVADIAVSSIQMNIQRQEFVDFSIPITDTGISILYVKPERVRFSLTSFMKPFSRKAWLFLGVNVICMTVLLFLNNRNAGILPSVCGSKLTYILEIVENIFDAFWSTLARVLNKQSLQIHMTSQSGIILCSLSPLVILMSTLVSATLVSYLIKQDYYEPIKSLEDLVTDTTTIKFGGGVSNTVPFREAGQGVYRHLWEKMLDFNQTEQVLFQYSEDAYSKVKQGGFALFMEGAVLEAVLQKDCQLAKVGGALNQRFYAIVFPKGFRYRSYFNEALLKLFGTGTLKAMKDRWKDTLKRESICEPLPPNEVPVPIHLESLWGIMFIIFIGIVTGAICLLCECFLRSYVGQYGGKVSGNCWVI